MTEPDTARFAGRRQELVDEDVIRAVLRALGCGLGGLKWTDVKPCIRRAFAGVADLARWSSSHTAQTLGEGIAPRAEAAGNDTE